jgi:hypothetical protein
MKYRTLLSSLVLMALAFVHWAPSSAARPPEDGFVAAQTLQSRYFTVFVASGTDGSALVRSLNISPGHKILAGYRGATDNLPDLLDALFVWANNVLDMQVSSYKGTIKITLDGSQLKELYRRLYGIDPRSDKAFYIWETNTLYICSTDFTKEILGHEMAHAIISNFFVVQPPAKVAEVLAGYIEYELRKSSRPSIR